jgi:hypothetical protein
MTKVIEGVKVLTYDEWQKLPEVLEMFGTLNECSTCDGEGVHECECGHTHTCNACDGSGKENDFRDIYETKLRDEIRKLIAWRDGLAIKHLSYMGDKQNEPVNAVSINIHGNAG